MAFDPDRLIERRRLKRGLIIWRTLAIVGLVVLAIVAVMRFGSDGVMGERIVRLWVDGLVIDDPRLETKLDDIAKDSGVKAVIVRIDSPGGTATGGEAMYLALRRIAQKKPVIAVMGTTAASGGYMVALAADQVFARVSTITGSIGVILQTAEVTELLADLGIKAEAIKSGPLKAQPSPFERMTDEARTAVKAVIDDTYKMFVDMVVERRNLPRDVVLTLADGRIFTGRQAKELGLIDAIGGEQEALEWLKTNRAIASDLPISELKREDFEGDWLDSVSTRLGNAIVPARLRLDGLVTLWQAHPGK
ncbi:MAG: signal peptide peptidase SppA [Alphaproteobacteria bacterium]|nr:signal peptide peptidase SppA [Alphaproteobacteria bacterium]